MRAFIIRPFGTKGGIDFEKVDAELISPALDALGISGRTTGEIIAAGNIREDMFQLLLVSDLVVADISIDNPNAYYELGIRHGLREKGTFLLRAAGQTNQVPFDLRTDRYLSYDASAPGSALAALTKGLKATLESERPDSPVFRLLPQLREQDRSKFLPLPREFREEVDEASRTKAIGKLALLGDEARGALWETEGLRLVGRELFGAEAFEAACTTLESLRIIDPLDKDANLLLGTIYQRLGNLPQSEVALRRVAGHPDTPPTTAKPRTILFTGHQVDAPGRKTPRFPADKEPLARDAIRSALQQQLARYGSAIGIAGAASGGDIVFHEVCAELAIPTRLYLALPPDVYVTESVAPAGRDWIRRFWELESRFQSAPVLARSKELPGWLRHKSDYSIWQRNNLWMLNEALADGARNVTLLALWNGQAGDGPGGTADMINVAQSRGAEAKVLDTNALFGLAAPAPVEG